MKNGIPKTAQTGGIGTVVFKACSGKPWVFIFIVVACLLFMSQNLRKAKQGFKESKQGF